jgi:pimeloyl-ACP methyl ester carboxylesterase
MAYLTRPDLRTNYQILGPAGTGRAPLALIHGLGANLAFWYLGAAPLLARDHQVIMHDMRGHGASSMPATGYDLAHLAADFRDVLDATGTERAHVVGHSHGARVALAFALAHPERVASLTIADTQLRALQAPMRLGDWPHWPRWKADLAAQGVTSFPPEDALIDFRVLADLGPRGRAAIGAAPPPVAETPAVVPLRPLLQGARPRLARLLEQRDGAAGPPAHRIDLRNRQMGARSGRQWQALLDETSAPRDLDDESAIAIPDLARFEVPTLLLYGEVSHCVPTSDRLLERLPHARRILVPGAGHFFPLVKPRSFARALRQFVAGVETANTPARRRFVARVLAARGARSPADRSA